VFVLWHYLRDARVSNRFESALAKIGQARKHADDLEAEISAFRASCPCEVEMAGTPSADQGSFRVRRMAAVPDSIPLIVGDAAHNLRSALDHAAWSAVLAELGGTRTYFPVWAKTAEPAPDEWRQQVSRQLKGASPEFIEAVAGLEAWESGRDSPLWAIHELDRIDKHRLLLSVAVVVTGIGLYGDSYELAVVKKYSGMEAGGPLLVEPRELAPVEEGRVLFGSLSDFGVTGAAFFYDVALQEPPMMRGRPAMTWLRILADRAEKVIKDLAPLA
jgi:hypothetical protein